MELIFGKIIENIDQFVNGKTTDFVKVEGFVDDIFEADKFQHFGFRSHPTKSTTGLIGYLSKQKRNIVNFASKNYNIELNLETGETIIFATDEDDNVKSTIKLKDGIIEITSDTVDVIADNVNLGTSGEAIARKDDLVTGQVIIPSGSSAGTYPITNGKISTGSANNTSN